MNIMKNRRLGSPMCQTADWLVYMGGFQPAADCAAEFLT